MPTPVPIFPPMLYEVDEKVPAETVIIERKLLNLLSLFEYEPTKAPLIT